jgi:hypothetical protein
MQRPLTTCEPKPDIPGNVLDPSLRLGDVVDIIDLSPSRTSPSAEAIIFANSTHEALPAIRRMNATCFTWQRPPSTSTARRPFHISSDISDRFTLRIDFPSLAVLASARLSSTANILEVQLPKERGT